MENYFPVEIKGYLEMELYSNPEHPLVQGIKEKMKTSKDELEGLGGLLTHRFGNLIIWGCNYPDFRNFFIELLKSSEEIRNSKQWAFRVAEKCVYQLLGIKL